MIWRTFLLWWQRAQYGVAEQDVMDLGSYVARILVRALPALQYRNGQDWAWLLTHADRERYLSYLRGESAWTEQDEAGAMARWDQLIDEIVEPLRRAYGPGMDPVKPGRQELDRAWRLFADYAEDLWL